jgi:sensor histidine kinase regulating citrate/malate metabolism
MNDDERKNRLGELINFAVDGLEVAVSIIDTKGTLLYYNRHATKILDRKPEYLGSDIHSHHKEADSNKKVSRMLKEFEAGRKDPFHYEAKPYGEIISVTLSPILKNGKFVGCVQTVRPQNTAPKNEKP